jgi:hypothetical protein
MFLGWSKFPILVLSDIKVRFLPGNTIPFLYPSA